MAYTGLFFNLKIFKIISIIKIKILRLSEMNKKLERYKFYTRKEVFDIFSPKNKTFSPGAGDWGNHGIIPIPETNDFIFYITYGTILENHTFDEGINENGILTWQSQPRMNLKNETIKKLIKHDATNSNIYLFLRTEKKLPYSYIGLLEYLEHDNQRENPVYFKWQILDFDKEVLERSLPNLKIQAITKDDFDIDSCKKEGKLILTEQLEIDQLKYNGVETDFFKAITKNFIEESERNSILGIKGEEAVIKYEKERLISAGKKELADKVIATRETLGNTARYDVHSYEEDGNDRYIEVKTTTGLAKNKFYISENEVEFSEKYSDNYYLYRVYEFNLKTEGGKIYIKKGAIKREKLVPITYIYG